VPEARIYLNASVVRVLFTEPEAYDDALREDLPGHWECIFKSFGDEDELARWVGLQSYDVVFGRIGLTFGGDFFRASPSIKILATPTTGLDHIDLKAADEACVRVLSLRGELDLLRRITSTAEHAWGLLLACNRRIPELVERTRSGSWARGDLELHQLSNQTLGIIGLGRLGRMVADYARAFRMQVLGYDPYIEDGHFPQDVDRLSLEALLSSSDHVILTATYSPGDPVILSRNRVFAMKPGSTFVNVARGELTDEAALVEALDLGILRAVGVDVLPGDSRWTHDQRVSSPLIEKSRQTHRVLVTPHVGGYAREALNETRRFMVQRVNQIINIEQEQHHEIHR
jgi:D-3-phosphoglycerate dehydrogenase / 2-oxoglutarate reductase